jgi:molecular chaperone GrpE
MGVQPIATVGEIFDPHFHEAVATEESNEHEPETISAELLRGYRIGDHVIRHSMVRVVKGPSPVDPDDKTSDEVRPQTSAPEDTNEE